MATQICITPEQEAGLKKAREAGEFSLSKLQATKSSAERLELVRKHIPDEEVSKKIVRDIETRLGSKKETIVEDYIKRTLKSVPEETRKGVLNKFKRMSSLLGAKEEKDFMEELVAHKFGSYITKEEANKLEKLTFEAVDLREKAVKVNPKLDPESLDDIELTPESVAYGEKMVELENAETLITVDKTKVRFSDTKKFKGEGRDDKVANWSNYLATLAKEGAGATRSFKATADLSAAFRQLHKILSSGVYESVTSGFTNNRKLKIWWNAMKTTYEATSKTSKFGDERVYDALRAKIHAHPNSIDGVYDVAVNSYGLRVSSEEQFPSSIPSEFYDKKFGENSKGNVFKISEVAFNSTVLQARFDLANLTIATLRKAEANVMKKEIADAAGEFVGAFTGRASLGKFESAATELNKWFFAPRFAMSQISPIIEIVRGGTTRKNNPAARLAAKNNLQFIAGTAGLMVAAESIRAFATSEESDLVSITDPRSNRFGKVKFPGTNITLDMTGGNRSVVSLMGKMFSDKYYDARLGVWREKGFFQTTEGKPIYDFITGKFAPIPALLRDLKRGQQFGGGELKFGTGVSAKVNVVSARKVVTTLLMPITIENVFAEAWEKEDLGSAALVLFAEGAGIGASDFRFKPQGDEWSSLLNTDSKAYWRAVDELWESTYSQAKALRNDAKFQALPRSEQAKKLEKMYKRELDKVIRQDKYEEVYAAKLEILEAEKEISVLDK